MTDQINNGNFTRNVALAIGSLLVIAGTGWTASNILNGKADATDVQAISADVQELKTQKAVDDQVNADIARRLANIEAQINEISKKFNVPIIPTQ